MLVLHDQGYNWGWGVRGDRYYVNRSSPISKLSSQWNIMTEKQHFKKACVYEEGCCNNSMQQSLKTIITYFKFVYKGRLYEDYNHFGHFFPGTELT